MERPILPPRGVLYDRFKEPLVENVPLLGLLFDRRMFFKEKGALSLLRERLQERLGFSNEFLLSFGFPEEDDPSKLPPKIILSDELSLERLVKIAPHLDELPGVQIFESYRRVYQDPMANAHLLGFVGKVSEEDLAREPQLELEAVVGKSGLEAFYDSEVRGRSGRKIVEVDSSGRETRFRMTQESAPGSGLILTVEGGLQKIAYEVLTRYIGGKKGASVIAVDPRDGAVRALLSSPSFNITNFGQALSPKEFEARLKDPLKPFFNRAISGEFPSGSTIKPILAAAILEESLIDPDKKIYTEGFIEIPNPYKPGEKSVFLDWKNHGWVNFYDAIAQSVNVYFYTLGGGYKGQKGLGIEKIKKYALAFGFGSKLGIDLPGERTGFLPDPETKKITEPDNPVWRVGDTYNVSIGQGGVKVTPLQMTMATAAIANGGKIWQPHIMDAVLDEGGNIKERYQPRLIRENFVSKENLSRVVRGMRQTVTSGTARLLAGLPVSAAAKTGTAQAGSGLPHAWVTVFAPVEKPEIAITVMVEHAGEGATVAVPITRDILQWYFQSRKLSTVD